MSGSKRSSTQLFVVVLLALAVIPLTVYLAYLVPDLSLASALLLLLLEVVVVAILSNLTIAVLTAVGAVLLANWFLVPPQHTLFVSNTDDIVVLSVFVVSALGASLAVTWALRSRAEAETSRTEVVALRQSLATPTDEADPVSVLDRIKEVFDLDDVQLLDPEGTRIAQARGDVREPKELEEIQLVDETLQDGYQLTGFGPLSFGADRRLLTSLGTVAVRSYEARQLTREAGRADELAATDRARSALLASVGHDLRTPIAAIAVSASALRSETDLSSPDRDALVATIAESAQRLDDLVANLLDMSRLEAGQLMTSIVATDVDEALANAALSLGDERVDIQVAADIPQVMADPGLLERVLANLVSNAQRHCPLGTSVILSAKRHNGTVRLMVIDQGPGLATEDAEQIFRPFQRASDGAPGGVGLGLAIAKGFTEAMGGTLKPLPTPGGGLTMAVDLPVAP